KPYLSLLASLTPADLSPFIQENSSLWRDGYLARFGIICPSENDYSDKRFPEGTIPPDELDEITAPLTAWHERLGVPKVKIDYDDNERKYEVFTIDSFTEQDCILPQEVVDAYYTYDGELRQIIASQDNHDLDGSYGRAPMQALRITALLASLESIENRIKLCHWYRAQRIVE